MPEGTEVKNYTSYEDFMGDNKATDPKEFIGDLSYAGKSGDDGLLFKHACVMSAAYTLSQKDPNGAYDEKALVKNAKELMRKDEIRIGTMDRNILTLANFGHMEDFDKVIGGVKRSFKVPSEEKDLKVSAVKVKRAVERLTGHREGEEKQKFVERQERTFRNMVSSAEDYVEKCEKQIADPSGEHLKPADAMRVFSSAADYQEGREKKSPYPEDERDLKASLDLMKTVSEGTGAERFYQQQVGHIKNVRQQEKARETEVMNKEPEGPALG